MKEKITIYGYFFKVLDSFDHHLLVNKLRSGLPSIVLIWLKSYLNNSVCSVSSSGNGSTLFLSFLEYLVSIFVPFLFLLFKNDPRSLFNYLCSQYAGDLKLFFVIDSHHKDALIALLRKVSLLKCLASSYVPPTSSWASISRSTLIL